MTKIALLSDIHEYRPYIDGVDIAIFCGDFSHQMSWDFDAEANLWNELYHSYFTDLKKRGIKLVGCGGNHDFLANGYNTRYLIEQYFDLFSLEGVFEFAGFNFMFLAYCNLEDWSLFIPNDKLKQKCDRLSVMGAAKDIDFLVTHRPPYNILDGVYISHFGSLEILELVNSIKPKHLHCFGHSHEARGILIKDDLRFVNCSYCDRGYNPLYSYFVYDTTTKEITEVTCGDYNEPNSEID